MSNLHPICCWCVCIYAPNYHSINMNFCFCILPRLFGCTFPSIYVYLLSAVCVCVTGPGSVPQRFTLSVSMSLRLSRRRHSSPSLHRSKSWHMPQCPFSFPSLTLTSWLCHSCNLNPLSFSLTPIFLSLYPAFSPTISVGILIPLQQRSKLSMQTR